jgi:Na+/proline symporter
MQQMWQSLRKNELCWYVYLKIWISLSVSFNKPHMYVHMYTSEQTNGKKSKIGSAFSLYLALILEPILRLLNLQLQR